MTGYVPSSKQQGARDLLIQGQRNLMYIPCVSWECQRQLYCPRTKADLRGASAEHSCSGFTSKQKSLASAHLPECCSDNSHHKCCCKQLYSKSVLKQSKPESQTAFESILQGQLILDQAFRKSQRLQLPSWTPSEDKFACGKILKGKFHINTLSKQCV